MLAMYDAFERYALYWVPTVDQRIARFGLEWTGWCAETGEHHPRRPIKGIGGQGGSPAGALARHGLHGVLAAPFELARGRNVWALEQALDHVAGVSAPVRVPALRAAVVGGRISLVPQRPVELLDGLIGRVRAALYGLVAPESDAAAEERFHIPLCEATSTVASDAALERVQAMTERLRLAPLRIGDVALMGDPGHGRPLRVLRRYNLSAWEPEPARRGALEARGPQLLAGIMERTCPSPTLCFG